LEEIRADFAHRRQVVESVCRETPDAPLGDLAKNILAKLPDAGNDLIVQRNEILHREKLTYAFHIAVRADGCIIGVDFSF